MTSFQAGKSEGSSPDGRVKKDGDLRRDPRKEKKGHFSPPFFLGGLNERVKYPNLYIGNG